MLYLKGNVQNLELFGNTWFPLRQSLRNEFGSLVMRWSFIPKTRRWFMIILFPPNMNWADYTDSDDESVIELDNPENDGECSRKNDSGPVNDTIPGINVHVGCSIEI
ncbi:hypothetical protein M5689_012188 [Euphorbia peplus]|nr:hypothetical protein M5689_012188 [Euphorbia peplus]